MVVRNTIEPSNRPRTRGTRPFPHRLAAYSVAAGATMLAADAAQAEIVYHNPGPQFVFDDSLLLNMNPPGDTLGGVTDDLAFEHTYFAAGYFGTGINAPNGSGIAEQTSVFADMLGADDPIDGALTFDGFSTLGYKDYYGTGGNWPGQGTGFLGVRLNISGNNHYGWVRLNVDGVGGTIGIFDWAYESNADTQILAGAGATVPEPATLGMLALGAAGLLGWRACRRKKVGDGRPER